MPAFFKQSPQLPMQLIPGEEVELGSLLLTFSPDLLIAPPGQVQLLCQAFPGNVCLASNIALTAIEVGSIQAG